MKKNIIILILVLAFIGILFLLDWPIYNKFVFLNSEVERYENLLEEEKGLLVKVNQLKEIYESREDELKKVHYSLPAGKEVPNLIIQFEALTSENGLILESLDFTEQESRKTDKSLSVSLSISGTYQSFESFLEALELNVRLMDVQSIDFSSAETEAGSSIFTFDVKLEVYYQ